MDLQQEQHRAQKEMLSYHGGELPLASEHVPPPAPAMRQLQTLLSWTAPGRPFQKKNKQFYLNVLVIMLLVQVILFLFSQYILMVLVVALVFLAYALGTVAPHDFHYKITSEGIKIEDQFFLWQELYDFYFQKKNGQDVLIVGTKAFFPGELTLVLGPMHMEHVRTIMAQYLPFREYVKPTFTEKAALWLERTFPLDNQPHPQS